MRNSRRRPRNFGSNASKRHGDFAFACGRPGLTIVPASSRPDPPVFRHIATGDPAFDSDVFVEAAERSAHGLFDHQTREILRRLVCDERVVLTSGVLQCDEPNPSPGLRKDMNALARRLTKTQDECVAALREIAFGDPMDSVRKHYQSIARETLFEGDLSNFDAERLIAELADTNAFEPLADLARNPSAPKGARLIAMERLMSHFPWNVWAGIVETEVRLIPTYLSALQRDQIPAGAAIVDFYDFAEFSLLGPVSPEVGIAVCGLVERALDADVRDIEDVVWVLQDLCKHADERVVQSAAALLFRVRPDLVTSLELHHMIAVLAAHGQPRHIRLLSRLARGFFRASSTKSLAQDAIDAIRARSRDLDGALSETHSSPGGLTIASKNNDGGDS